MQHGGCRLRNRLNAQRFKCNDQRGDNHHSINKRTQQMGKVRLLKQADFFRLLLQVQAAGQAFNNAADNFRQNAAGKNDHARNKDIRQVQHRFIDHILNWKQQAV